MRTLAYLDGNTGSLIASALVAGGAAFVLFAKMGWQRFLGVFMPSRRARYKEMRAAIKPDADIETTGADDTATAEAPDAAHGSTDSASVS